MIPPFNEHGYLPPGIHRASLDEIEARFGLEPELRRVQMESLRWLVEIAQRAGVERLIVNGSFATDEFEPNDVDCDLLAKTRRPDGQRIVARSGDRPHRRGGICGLLQKLTSRKNDIPLPLGNAYPDAVRL